MMSVFVRLNPLLHQSILNGIVDQFGIVLHAHFFQDARSVCTDGLDAQGQIVGDLALAMVAFAYAARVRLLRGAERVPLVCALTGK